MFNFYHSQTMKKAFAVAAVFVCLALGVRATAQPYSGDPPKDPVLEQAVVRVADHIKLPAEEPGLVQLRKLCQGGDALLKRPQWPFLQALKD